MRKERKTQCYLTLINVKTVTCSFVLFFSRLSCELLHYNCSFQRIKRWDLKFIWKAVLNDVSFQTGKKKKGEPVLCAETDPEYREFCLVPNAGHLAHWPTLSPHRPLVLGWGTQKGSASGTSFTPGCPGPSQNAEAFLKFFNVSTGSPGPHQDWQCHLGGNTSQPGQRSVSLHPSTHSLTLDPVCDVPTSFRGSGLILQEEWTSELTTFAGWWNISFMVWPLAKEPNLWCRDSLLTGYKRWSGLWDAGQNAPTQL